MASFAKSELVKAPDQKRTTSLRYVLRRVQGAQSDQAATRDRKLGHVRVQIGLDGIPQPVFLQLIVGNTG